MAQYPTPEFNPYAPPMAAPAQFQPLAYQGYDPMFGVWRQGKLLVMHKAAPLPDRCVKSNKPANGRTLRRKLHWHHPAIYLAFLAHFFIYMVLALVMQKKADIQIGLCDEWFARRRNRILVAWGLVLLGGVLVGVGISQIEAENGLAALILAGCVVALGGAIYGVIAARLVSPKKITDTHVWLKGVHPDYLAQLPEWPFPY